MNRYRKTALPWVVASEKILGRAALALLAIVLSGLGPALQAQAQSQSTDHEKLQSELSAMRAERDQVRQRVERLLAQLDALEL